MVWQLSAKLNAMGGRREGQAACLLDAAAAIRPNFQNGGGAMEYDVVIVGAGSAGATLAARLTETAALKTGGLRVALIEAGPDYRSHEAPEAMSLPNPARIIIDPAHADFRYDALTARRTRVQEARTYWRGRGLGGSSAINGQIAIRAAPAVEMAIFFPRREGSSCPPMAVKGSFLK